MNIRLLRYALPATALLAVAGVAVAHGVAERDAAWLEQHAGQALVIFGYLGAKHMVTGYDHLLYLLGVIFFLRRPRDIALYVTLFAAGHSLTLLGGVLGDIRLDPRLVDAVIGLSVAYKAFENLDGFRLAIGWQPDPRIAVFAFGLVHGFGLATKLQRLTLSSEGLVWNIVAFNVGVELGQLLALAMMLFLITAWRATGAYATHARGFNAVLMFAGFLLTGYQLAAYWLA